MELIRKNDHQIIIAYTKKYLDGTRRSRSSWIRCELLERLVAERKIDDALIASGDQFIAFCKRLEKRVERYLEESSAFPESWKYPWIDSLGYLKDELLSVLIGRIRERLSVSNVLSPERQPAYLHRVTESIGEVLKNAKPAFDGFYDSGDDIAQLDKLSSRLTQVIEYASDECRRLNRVKQSLESAAMA